MKCRIVKRKCGDIEKFTIQQKHFLFRWWWVDAWVNSSLGAACTDTFNTLEESKNNLWIIVRVNKDSPEEIVRMLKLYLERNNIIPI